MVPLPNGWSRYLVKASTHHSIAPNEWKDPQILGYLLNRFKLYTGRDFALTFKKSPTKSPELHFIKVLKAMLTTSNGEIIKQYIDWCFDKKIIANNIQIRSFALLNNNTFVNDFLYFRSKESKLTRSTAIPLEWKEKAKELDLEVETYGDLIFIKMSVERGDADIVYGDYYRYLCGNGLNVNILEGLDG